MASEPSSERQKRQKAKIAQKYTVWLLNRIPQKVSLVRLGLFCGLVVTLFLAMTPSSLLTPIPFVVGQTFPYEIRAHRTVRYISEIATEKRRQALAQAVPRQYRLDPSVASRWQAILNDLMESVVNVQKSETNLSEKVAQIRQWVGLDIPNQVLTVLLQVSPTALKLAHEVLTKALELEWGRGIKPIPEEQAEALKRVRARIDEAPLSSELKWALKRLAELALQPNMVYDPVATQRAKEQIAETVEPVWVTIKTGELIARKGELVTEEHLEKLKAIGYNSPALIGVLLLTLILAGSTALFLRAALPSIFSDNRQLALLLLLWGVTTLTARFLSQSIGVEVAFVAVATAAMMTSVSVSPLFGVFASGLFALTLTLGLSVDWESLVMGSLNLFLSSTILGSSAAILSADARNRMQLIQVGIALTVIALLIPLVVGLVTGETQTTSWSDFQRVLIWSLLTGATPPALTLSGVSALERLFGVTTFFTLTELANPNNPLLKELAEKAPGTFQSSLMVARLAQEAAKRVGANDLLAWVGGLYHDIGKLYNPVYFIENQPFGAANIHDRVGPHLSAIVLEQHVKQGEKLARENRLPEPIINIIREHHGTSLMAYFWDKARKQGEVVEHDFRYEGPKPQSKESAIIMLADSVEAAVKSLPNPSHQEIEELVDEVVNSKLADGQLDESPLSMKDLQEIKRAFVETLKSIYHQRIEYPKVKLERDVNGTKGNYHGVQTHQTPRQQKVNQQIETSG